MITTAKDKSGRPVKKDGLQKYRVRVNYTVYALDGTASYKVIERTAYGKNAAQEMEIKLQEQVAGMAAKPSGAPKTVRDLSEEYLRRMQFSGSVRDSTHAKKQSIQETTSCHTSAMWSWRS